MKDITHEIDIVRRLNLFPHGLRVMMSHKGKTIGVLKSKGWDLTRGYNVIYNPHPGHAGDDSWITVYLLEGK